MERKKSARSARNDGVLGGTVGVGAWPGAGLDWDRQARDWVAHC